MLDLPLTDYGNAQRLVAMHGADLRYCVPWHRWLVWDRTRWNPDQTGEVMRRSKDVTRQLYAKAASINDDTQRRRMVDFARASEAERRLCSMINLAQTEPGIAVLPQQLDADPLVLNCLNGALDLRTGSLRPPRREDLLSMMAPVAYDSTTTCPLWLEFLKRVTNGETELISYLKRMTGYLLTGSTAEQVLFIFLGAGANGKTTYIETIAAALGDYAAHTPTETLLVKRGADSIPNDVARLVGTRLVAAVETEEGRRLATAKIKQMTGGDTITARFMRAEFFEFKPQFKIVMSVNHRPIIRDTTNSIWRRIRMIPFDVKIPERERDKALPDKLQGELPGILNWAVQGCLEWQHEGLGLPPSVQSVTQSYRDEMDVVQTYLNERCQINPTARIEVSALYQNHVDWCRENGEKSLSNLELTQRLKEKGFSSRRSGAKGNYQWHGIGL